MTPSTLAHAETPTHAHGHQRLAQLYKISKLFTAFDSVEDTLDAALNIVAHTLPLESAILIDTPLDGPPEMIVWSAEGGDPDRLRVAKAHAERAYDYMIGSRPTDAIKLRDGLGLTTFPVPRRDRRLHDAHRFIVLPLVVSRRPAFGALQLEGGARFDREDLEFVGAITNQLAIALDRNHSRSHDVARRREAQMSQAKYEALIDDLDYAFVWEADASTRRLTYVSAQFQRILGFPRHQGLDALDWWSAHVHPDDRAQLALTFERALVEPGNKRCDHRCIAADGGIRWLHTSIHLAGAGGEPPRFQGVSVEITSAHTAQERVREQLAFTTAMASSLGEGTLAVDLEGRITFLNDAGARLLGCVDRNVLGLSAHEVARIETTDGELVESPLAVTIRTGGRLHSDQHVVQTVDGVRFAASYTATPIRRDGRITGAIVAFDDTSERRDAIEDEHFMLDVGAKLSASLESAAVASAIAGLAVPRLAVACFVDVLGADDQLVRVAWEVGDPTARAALERAFGTRSQIVTDELVVEVAQTGRSRQIMVGAETWLSIPDPTIAHSLGIRNTLIVPLALGARQLGALTLCMTGDRAPSDRAVMLAEALARRSALAIEHARLYEQARHAVAMREQTLAIASHDLRAPLQTITLAVGLLGADKPSTTSRWSTAVAIDKIQVAADRMERLIGDLLDFASIEAGRLSIVACAHDIGALVDESIAAVENLARKRVVRLTAEVADDLPPVQCDRDRILQVIGNLLGNALAAVKPGDGVHLRAYVVEREAVFEVSDTGPGIALADQARLFERYWRSPDASYKGVGLGLAIAQGLVKAHHGRIWIDSEPGHGATFAFSLPLAPEPR